MDFAPEPVLDAFTPPPTRQAPRAAAPDGNGRSFDDHLEAVNEAPAERPAPSQNEAKDEAKPVEAKPAPSTETEPSDEPLDPDVALLGGPTPPAPPPMAAPVIVQIAASQPEPQAQPQDADVAPVTAPEAPAPVAPQREAAAAEPVEQAPPAAGKGDETDVRSAAADAPQQNAQAQQQAQNTAQATAQQSAPQAAAAPVDVQELPAAAQQAIAQTIASAPQAVAPTTSRTSAKTTVQPVAAKVETDPRDAKAEAPATHANAKAQAQASKAASNGNVAIETVAAPITQASSSAPDASQLAQSNAITATASQASTQVQHAAVDVGAQRAAPAGAQVGREIIRRFDGGNTNFELRLDPAELGRVEVRMEVTRDHRVTAVITADNPQALTELARNARELEQQLQSAGLQLGDNGLSFDLRQGAQGGGSDEANNNARGSGGAETPAEQQPTQMARPIGYERWRGVRVDMMV